MSHRVEKADTVYVPEGKWGTTWHKLETVVKGPIALDGSNIPNVFHPIIELGVRPVDLPGGTVLVNGVDAEIEKAMSAWKLICADLRNHGEKAIIPLYVPKKGYAIRQNRKMFDCMVAAAREVLGDNNFEIVTTATLGNYSQFMNSIAIKGQTEFSVGTLKNGTADVWNRFFNLISSHNGDIATSAMLSLIRMVCWNTVNASVNESEESGTNAKLRHTENNEITPEWFEANLRRWLDDGLKFKMLLEACKSATMNVEQFKAFAAGVFTIGQSDALSTISYNRVNDMVPLFQNGTGNGGASRYDAINAFTEYFTSGKGVGSEDVDLGKRIASANFGRGNEWKLEATRVATDEESFNAAMARGEALFTDKQKVVNSAN